VERGQPLPKQMNTSHRNASSNLLFVDGRVWKIRDPQQMPEVRRFHGMTKRPYCIPYRTDRRPGWTVVTNLTCVPYHRSSADVRTVQRLAAITISIRKVRSELSGWTVFTRPSETQSESSTATGSPRGGESRRHIRR
jgi:prepilin-type processing-associated H-X9-DG protein